MLKNIVGFILVFVALLSVGAVTVSAQNASEGSTLVIEKPIEQATPPASVTYELPYPGVLPDNPLYFLKAIRDRLVSILINDSIKKAEFNLLTSDKRIFASQMLVKKGKDELAISTLSKSTNYFEEAIRATSEAQRMGKNVDSLLQNLDQSVLKHREVVKMLEKDIDKKFAARLSQEAKRLENLKNSVEKLSPSK